MKLIIQIPCKNEVDNLEVTLNDLPKEIPGVDSIETFIIDDGSTDETTEKAIELGVDHVLRFETNRGLARTFASALKFSRTLGADIIMHTDADNQYQGKYIKDLVGMLIDSKAGMVVGIRDIADIPHFSKTKKILQRLGSRFVGIIARYPIPDAPSGFRAYTNITASKLTILSRYTYTLETLVQARIKGIKVEFIPIKTNPKLRESRLMASMADYIYKSALSLITIVLLYEPIWVGISASIVAFLLFISGWVWGCGAPTSFLISSIAAINIFLGGWLLALLIKFLTANRIQNEDSFLYNEPEYTPIECARRLGASSYYKKGDGRIMLTKR